MGLYVVEFGADFRSIDEALRREIDERLALDWEIDLRYDARCYFVLCHVAGDREPVRIADWRDEFGRPLPLSSGILERVRSQRARGGVAVQEAFAANEALVERAQREADEASEEIAREMLPRVRGRKKTMIPRSHSLMRARDKRRARGEIA